MIEVSPELLEKHKVGIEAAYNYYVNNMPTGLDDAYYDHLEEEARKDGLELRDYVTQSIQGKRTKNADYIGKVEKLQVQGDMVGALYAFVHNNPSVKYITPKYDGSSLAAYYDVATGKCIRVVTIGGSNLGSEGIDQTEKFARYFPNLPDTGICALHSECLVSLEHGLGETSRQKANGLVNASYEPLDFTEFKGGKGTKKEYSKYLVKFQENQKKVEKEIDDLINIRCFRFFVDPSSQYSQLTLSAGYKAVLSSLPEVYNSVGDIKFCGGLVFDADSEYPDTINSDIWNTGKGTFLVDGVVTYTETGVCYKALKYKDAGRGESTEVLGIKWNDQSKKGKDSWSANVLINPINIRGAEIKKPSVGSVRKMVDSGLSKGSRVTVILANSTIPAVSKVLNPGNLDFEWPTCGCGHKMGESDIFGALLKCGNPDCSERLKRMRAYLDMVPEWKDINLNKLLVIDRFDWSKKVSNLSVLSSEILEIVYEDYGVELLKKHLGKYLTTDLQKRNLDLVVTPAYKALREYVSRKYTKS